MATQNLVWFITGANAGFGLLLTELALSHGHTVVATARSFSKFPDSLKSNPKADLVEVEISGPGSAINAVVAGAIQRHGQIDVLVNNAGFGHLGAVEEVSEAEARYQFDVNFFGLLNFTKAVIPYMREQKSGIIVQVSSGAGLWAGVGGPIYVASKHAVEGLAEGLANEVKPLGIRVHLVEPGIFRTDFLKAASQGKQLGEKKEGYLDNGSIMGGLHQSQPGDPKKAVQRMFEMVTGTGMGQGKEWDLRVPLGSDVYGMRDQKIKSLTETAEKMKDISLSTDFAS
ncbi:putative short chain oxidoreductase protein [Phaeoacremonium minimum UCRPA7]|uniref:Putative short chain oxidoreductase protein n=1 Tax=Phaeoacremonium minimum (strain UCR-PA7) TaxID=1286976 RepID=R8BJF8_PHAM7|nr:putative short chain oxidoreductase protein [Phaeoacremonium minimum UCRPA7]EON99414.1 putative short chain oxidoreductase protein [Phaeoacremonium minimum UCRPA7]